MQKIVSKPTRFSSVPSLLRKQQWEHHVSDLAGYIDKFWIETLHGDQLGVDFNRLQKIVRISIKPAWQKQKEYISVIKAGRILQERENSPEENKAPANLAAIIETFAPYFAKLEGTGLFKIIGGNYNFPKQTGSVSDDGFPIVRKFLFQQSPLQRLQEYLLNKYSSENKIKSPFRRFIHRLPQECFDMALGSVLIFALATSYLDLAEIAFFSGSLGIISGFWDMFWRRRSPFLFKIVYFMGIGVAIVYLQVQYRMWGIFI